MESGNLQTIIQNFTALTNEDTDSGDWKYLKNIEKNPDCSDPSANSLRAWKKLGPSSTEFTMRIECVYPFMEPEDTFNLIGDVKNRMS